MLDEVDKLGRDFRGDPSAALMEVLDPEQNSTFRDHYLDVPFDLSKVLFIATANWMDPIPEPLRDRMEIIELAGYTEEEKVHIANQYLIPKQAKEHGLKVGEQIEFTDEALHDMIHSYTREAGVRNLEREIATLTRKQARRIAEGKTEKLIVTPEVVRESLGVPKFRIEKEVEERVKKPGVSVGLVWTPVGGDIVFIEASKMRGGKQFTDDRASGRSDAGVHDRGADLGARERRALRHRSGLLPQAWTFTSTCRRARFRRTVLRPASRWSRRWSACSPDDRYGRAWR